MDYDIYWILVHIHVLVIQKLHVQIICLIYVYETFLCVESILCVESDVVKLVFGPKKYTNRIL